MPADLPTKTVGSLGPVKTDSRAYLRPSSELPAVELEAIKDWIILLATEIGDTDGSTAGSIWEALGGTSEFKNSVRGVSTANVNLVSDAEAGDTLDELELAPGDRWLFAGQTTAADRGIYVIQASGAPVRAADMLAGTGAAGAFMLGREGTGAGQAYWCTTARGSDVVGTNNLTFEAWGGDDCCALMGAYSPNAYTPTAATPVGQLTGIDNKLADLGSASVTVDPDGVLNHASANEVGALLEIEVNKAAGNYTAEQTIVTETAAPGTANKLKEWVVGVTTKITAWASGAFTVHNPGTAALPALEVDYGSGGKLGVYAPAANTIAVAANAKAVVLDGSATAALTPLTDGLLGLGTAALKWTTSFISKLVAPLIADASDLTKTISFVLSGITTGTNRTITMPDANVDLTRASQATVNTGTNATQAVTAATLANKTRRAPIALTSAGVGTYTISDAAAVTADGFPVRGDLMIDQQDAASDYMTYTIATAVAGSIALVVARNGQDAEFTASGVTLVYPDAQDGTAGSSQYVSAGVGTSDRAALLVWITATRVMVFGGDVA